LQPLRQLKNTKLITELLHIDRGLQPYLYIPTDTKVDFKDNSYWADKELKENLTPNLDYEESKSLLGTIEEGDETDMID
jgi:hypothetical protein